jgi:hypothetical protein
MRQVGQAVGFFWVCVSLGGCGAMVATMSGYNYVRDPANYDAVFVQTEVEEQDHQSRTMFSAPIVFARSNALDDWYRLRGYVYGDGRRSVQVYVRLVVRDWAFVEQGFSEGSQLSVTKVDSRVVSCSGGYGGCTMHEDVVVNLRQNEIDLAMEQGLSFVLVGRGGRFEFEVPVEYFRSFLDRLESPRRRVPSVASESAL